MLRLGGIYIQTGNRSQTMSRQEFNRCINIWKKAEAWENTVWRCHPTLLEKVSD